MCTKEIYILVFVRAPEPSVPVRAIKLFLYHRFTETSSLGWQLVNCVHCTVLTEQYLVESTKLVHTVSVYR